MLLYFLKFLELAAAYTEQEFMALPRIRNPSYNFLFTEDVNLLQNKDNSSEIVSLVYREEPIKCLIPNPKPYEPPRPIEDENIIAQARKALSRFEHKGIVLLDDIWGWLVAFDKGIIQFLPKYENGEPIMVANNFKATVGAPGKTPGTNIRSAVPVVVEDKNMMLMTYGNGLTCDLTGEPRSAKVYFTCVEGLDEQNDGDILLVSVDEPYSCSYELVLGVKELCGIPAFKKEFDNSNNQIICGPVLEATVSGNDTSYVEPANFDAKQAPSSAESVHNSVDTDIIEAPSNPDLDISADPDSSSTKSTNISHSEERAVFSHEIETELSRQDANFAKNEDGDTLHNEL